jgi:cell wall-associated NlpC family hydrolase
VSDPRIVPGPAATGESRPMRVAVPVVDLLRSPGGPRDRQLLLGEAVTVLGQDGSFAYLRAEKDGYHGHAPLEALDPAGPDPTHRVAAPATHAYTEPDIKSPDRLSLSFGSRISATGESDDFVVTPQGHIPKRHLRPAGSVETDPAAIALLFLGTPYLWGGNSRRGIDCSGLVQAALLACGVPCPGDSDLQQAAFPAASGSVQRGDLLFWKGHVAMALDDTRLVHANAHHMMTVIEDADATRARIGAPLAHLRP